MHFSVSGNLKPLSCALGEEDGLEEEEELSIPDTV